MILEIITLILSMFINITDVLGFSIVNTHHAHHGHHGAQYYNSSTYHQYHAAWKTAMIASTISGVVACVIIVAILCCCAKSRLRNGNRAVETKTTRPTVSYITTSDSPSTLATMCTIPEPITGAPPSYAEATSSYRS